MIELDGKNAVGEHLINDIMLSLNSKIFINERVEQFLVSCAIYDNSEFMLRIKKVFETNVATMICLEFDVEVFRIIYDDLYVILSNNEILKEFGCSDKAINVPTLFFPNWGSLSWAIEASGRAMFDAERFQLHQSLYGICVDILVNHEATHVINGHLGYLFSKGINVFQEGRANELTPLDVQTLEMDADSNAALMTYKYFEICLQQGLELPPWLNSRERILETICFCVHVIFGGVTYDPLKQIENLSHSYYPSRAMRAAFMTGSLYMYLQKYFPELDFQSIQNKALNEFVTLIKLKLIPKDVAVEMMHAYTIQGSNHVQNILENWKELFPRLQKFTSIDLSKL